VLVLGLDTSTPSVSVALVDTGRGVLAERTVLDGRRHGEVLAVGIRAVLSESGWRASDLEAIVVGLGPGPFTGLRVGIVTAASLADALGVSAYGVCSLDGLYVDGPGALAAVTDARRREVYWTVYDGGGARTDGPHVTKPDVAAAAMAGCRVVGAGALLYREAFAGLDVRDQPTAPAVEQLVRRVDFGRGPEPLVPLYLRRPDATEPVPR